MLAAPYRLRRPADISRVYRRGVYGGANGSLSLKAYAGGNPVSRAVVVVGKKVDKRAVVRNRIRRRLAAQLAGFWATLPLGYDIVISVHTDLRAVPADELHQLLVTALTRARLIAD